MDFVETPEQSRSGEPPLSVWLLSRAVPELRCEREGIALGPSGQEREDVAKVGPGLKAVELAAPRRPAGTMLLIIAWKVGHTTPLPMPRITAEV